MPEGELKPTIGQGAALATAVIGGVVLWLYRDVTTLDVLLRIALPALWLLLWSLACLGAGARPVQWLLNRGRAQDAVVVLLAGAAVLAFVQCLLALFGAFRPVVVAILLCLTAAEGLRLLVTQHRRFGLPEVRLASPPALFLVAVGTTLLVLTTAPPVMFDALNYHLAFPDHWLDAGGFMEFPRHFFSYYPSNHGLIYGFALSITGPWGAQAIHWWFGLMAALAAATLGQKVGGPDAAGWSAACFGLTPVALEVAGYAIADLAVAAWAGAALVVLIGNDGEEMDWRRAALCGWLVASAAGAKYLALATVMVPVSLAGAVGLWHRRHELSFRWVPPIIGFAFAAVVVLLPWLGRNAGWTGNPVYPYLQSLLGGPPCERDIARELGIWGTIEFSPFAWSIRALTAFVYRTFQPLREAGLLGPHWLLLLPAAVMTRRMNRPVARALWTTFVVGALAWGALVQYGRFLLPVLVPAAALAGTAAAALSGTGSRSLRLVFQSLLLAVLAWNATVIATDLNLDRMRVVAGHTSDRRHLERWVSYAPALQFVAEQLPADAHLLLVSEPRSLYLERPVLVEDPYRVPWLIDLARGCSDPQELARRLTSLGATHLLVNEGEMQWMARQRGAADYWSDTSEAERRVIRAFLNDLVLPMFRSDGVWIGELPPPSPDNHQGHAHNEIEGSEKEVS